MNHTSKDVKDVKFYERGGQVRDKKRFEENQVQHELRTKEADFKITQLCEELQTKAAHGLGSNGHQCSLAQVVHVNSIEDVQATSLSTLTHEQLCKLLEGTTSAQHEEILGQRLYPSVQAVDPVHAFKLIGMLLDAHMNLMTIDIVRLLDSPEMLLNNIKEAKEVLAASLARGDAGPVAESLEQTKTSEAKTEEQEMKAEKPKPQVPTPALTPALTPKSRATPQCVPLDLNSKPAKSLVPLKRGNNKVKRVAEVEGALVRSGQVQKVFAQHGTFGIKLEIDKKFLDYAYKSAEIVASGESGDATSEAEMRAAKTAAAVKEQAKARQAAEAKAKAKAMAKAKAKAKASEK